MSRCASYQALLLDHLHGLLDAEESLSLIEHVGQCDDCRAAMQKATLHKELLAVAARGEFAGVRFDEPTPEMLDRPTVPLRARRGAVSYRRWAMAAAVVLAVLGLGIPAGIHLGKLRSLQHSYDQAVADYQRFAQEERDLIHKYEQDLVKADRAFRAAQKLAADLEQAQAKEVQAAAQAVFAQDMHVIVKGPATLRVDEPTTYTIETRKLTPSNPMAGPPVPARLDVVVRDETTKQVIWQQKNIASNGSHSLVLGPDVFRKGGTGLALELTAASDSGARGEIREKLALARASYVTHLCTDRPIYQPGDTIWWRSLTLDRFTLRPASDDLIVSYTLFDSNKTEVYKVVHAPRLTDKDGKEILGPDRQPVRGIGTGSWTIPADQPGGEYILEVRETRDRFPPERRKFVINQYQKPRLNKDVKFDQESYGPGATVTANVKVEKAEGGFPLAHLPVKAVVRVDGTPYKADGTKAASDEAATIELKTNEEGKVQVKFRLPDQIERGDVSLNLGFTDGANYEALSRPVNVVVNRLQLELYPEGGDLVAGVANRVYFQARTPLDKPAAIKRAQLIDETGKVVLDNIRTFNDPSEPGVNQGNGRFAFTPQTGKRYQLKVIEPAIPQPANLPKVQDDGVVLSVASGVTRDQDDIHIAVTSVKKDRSLLVGIYCRGRLLGFQEVAARAGQECKLTMKPARDVGGVYRVTVFEVQPVGAGQQLRPMAERLIYRSPGERLNIAVRPDKRVYAPGENVKLSLTANDESGKAAPSILLVGVVDKSVLKMADERTARTMPTHFLLTSEVRRAEDLEYTDVLLTDHPNAAEALDLLLGTQGWRRFLESDPQRFRSPQQQKLFEEMKCKAEADRLFIAFGQMKPDPVRAFTTFELQQKQIIDRYAPRFDSAQAQLVQAIEDLQTLREGRDFDAGKRRLQEQAEQARAASAQAWIALRNYREFHERVRWQVLLVFAVLLLLASAGSVVIAVTRNLPRAIPFYGTAIAGVAVLGLIVLGTFFFDTQLPRPESVVMLSRTAPLDGPAGPAPGMQDEVWRPVDDANRPDARPVLAIPPKADPRAGMERAAADGKAGETKGAGMAGQPATAQQAGQKAHPPGAFAAMPQDRDVDQRHEKGMPRPVPTGALPPGAPPAKDAAALARQQMNGLGKGRRDEAKEARKADIGDHRGRAFLPPMAAPGRPAAPFPRAEPAPAFGAVPPAPDQMPQAPGLNAKFRQNAADGLLQDKDLLANRKGELQRRALENLDAKQLRELDQAKAAIAEQAAIVEQAIRKLVDERNKAEAMVAAPCFVREYAHQHTTGPDPDLRYDFAETLFWHPVVVLPNGKGEVQFQLCDTVTTFQIVSFGHTSDGRLGSFSGEFKTELPFNLSAVVPLEVTASDTIEMPVAVVNSSKESKTVLVSVDVSGMALVPSTDSNRERYLTLAPNDRGRVTFRMQPTIKEGNAIVKIKGSCEPFGSDAALYTIRVVPEGFPITEQVSDVLEGGAAQHQVAMPNQVIKGTLKARLSVFPSPIADLQKGLEGLLREPGGCFEQTSRNNYPNAMILNYLKATNQGDPKMQEQAWGMLQRGYGRLVKFECFNPKEKVRQGYEWFGGTAPAHEALTAYGLLQFRDMQRLGFPVDAEMVERTRKWLMERTDKKGGFLRNSRALDSFGRAPEHITNAYIVWAITESEGTDGPREKLDLEINTLLKQAKDSKDPYFLSLTANALLNRGMTKEAIDLLRKIKDTQTPEGFMNGAQTSITTSRGRDLQIETTALAVLAFLKANQPEFNETTGKAIRWIGQQRGGHGAFGSTQSTILALRALLTYSLQNNRRVPAGELVLTINNNEIGRQPLPADLKESLSIDVPDPEKHLKPGKNDVQIQLVTNQRNDGTLPYTFTWSYASLVPVSAEGTPIRMSAKLARDSARDGETVSMRVTVENTEKDKHQGMTVAIIGLPGGLNLPENLEQLRNYQKLQNDGSEPGKIAYFEVRGRELVLYWRQLKAGEKITLDIDLICRVPGEYRGPASRAYLYYNADHKHWIDPLTVRVAAQE